MQFFAFSISPSSHLTSQATPNSHPPSLHEQPPQRRDQRSANICCAATVSGCGAGHMSQQWKIIVIGSQSQQLAWYGWMTEAAVNPFFTTEQKATAQHDEDKSILTTGPNFNSRYFRLHSHIKCTLHLLIRQMQEPDCSLGNKEMYPSSLSLFSS